MRGIWFEYGDFKYPNDRSEAYHAYQAAAKQGYATDLEKCISTTHEN
jgi:hypothetical protein